MTPLGVVADGVAGAHADPLGDRSVALQLLGQLALDLEGLQGRLKEKQVSERSKRCGGVVNCSVYEGEGAKVGLSKIYALRRTRIPKLWTL